MITTLVTFCIFTKPENPSQIIANNYKNQKTGSHLTMMSAYYYHVSRTRVSVD